MQDPTLRKSPLSDKKGTRKVSKPVVLIQHTQLCQ